jgi:hypothetical protein
MRRGLLLTIGGLAVSLVILLVIGIAALPQYVVRMLDSIPAKYLLLQVGLLLIFIIAILLYWSLRIPKVAQVALGLFRACLSIAIGSGVVTPIGLFGLQSIAITTRASTSIDITRTVPLRTTTEGGAALAIVALIAACFAFLEFYRIRKYEFEHGLLREI